jgi:hypothetical protein
MMAINRHRAQGYNARGPIWLLAGVVFFGCSVDPGDAIEQRTGKVVFEDQSQIEFESGTPEQQEMATAVGILMPTASINRNNPNGTPKNCPDKTVQSFDCTAVLNVFSNALCLGEQWQDQESINDSCTAFMIRNDPDSPAVFATAGHCVGVGPSCGERSVVLRWRRSPGTFPGGNPNVYEQHIYQCSRVLAHGGHTDPGLTSPRDWAVFEVDRHVTGGGETGGPLTPEREPLVLSTLGTFEGEEISSIGHPAGMPTKIEPEGRVGGMVTNRGPGTFYVLRDAMAGESGAPVIDSVGEVIGITTGSKGPIKRSGETCFRQCFPPPAGVDECPPLPGLAANDPNAYATIAVDIAQLPSSLRTTAEHVMILLDQTGSMTAAGSGPGLTRWDDAVSAAKQWVQFDKLTAGFVERAYSIWTFRNDVPLGGTQTGLRKIWPAASSSDCGQFEAATGFCVLPRAASLEPPQYNALVARLETIRESERAVAGPNTPLAHSLCAGLEVLGGIDGLKRVIVESDGGENATDLADLCFGAESAEFGDWSTDLALRALEDWGMTLDSWPAKVVRRATRMGLSIEEAVASPLTAADWFPFDLVWHVDLHFGVSLPVAAFRATAAPEPLEVDGAPLARSGASIAAFAVEPGTIAPPEFALFKGLGQSSPKATFATFVQSPDNQFGVEHPVPGDVDNGGCVDSADLCIMMRNDVWQHRAVPPNTQAVLADLNRDGWVNEADRTLLVNGWGGGCASPTPPPNLDQAVAACYAEYARSWLSFEDKRRVWSVGVGSVQLSTTTATPSHLQQALQVNGCQYATINSPLFNTSELPAGSKLAFDVRLPTAQANPYWLGDVQLHMTIPGANVSNTWIGWKPFTGQPTGAYHTVTFDLPQSIRIALAGGYPNAQIHIALNTGNCLAPVLIDNVRMKN